jgi:hypothetical protein
LKPSYGLHHDEAASLGYKTWKRNSKIKLAIAHIAAAD